MEGISEQWTQEPGRGKVNPRTVIRGHEDRLVLLLIPAMRLRVNP